MNIFSIGQLLPLVESIVHSWTANLYHIWVNFSRTRKGALCSQTHFWWNSRNFYTTTYKIYISKLKLFKCLNLSFNNLILAVCRAHFAKEMTPFNFPRTRKGSFRSSTRAISIQNSSVVCSKASFSLTEYVSECSKIPNQRSFQNYKVKVSYY